MLIQATDPLGGILVVAIVLAILWVLMYSAAWIAVSGLRKPRFAASVAVSPEAVHFALANLGTEPAFDVTVSWDTPARPGERPLGRPGEPMARAVVLTPLKALEWDVSLPAVPNEVGFSRWLEVRWTTGTHPWSDSKRTAVAVLAPSRLES